MTTIPLTDVNNLPAFDSVVKCTKCGWTSTMNRPDCQYIVRQTLFDNDLIDLSSCDQPQQEPWMLRTCSGCGYQWGEQTKDYKESKA